MLYINSQIGKMLQLLVYSTYEFEQGRPIMNLDFVFFFPFSKQQTKELIAEIESLEEEVANREQHVLSLYRSVFEHSVRRPPSEQNSSVASPAHPKHESRKHPSIILSAFCSSKKFPFRPLQALVSIDEPGKRHSKTGQARLCCGRAHVDSAKSCSGPPKVEHTLFFIYFQIFVDTL